MKPSLLPGLVLLASLCFAQTLVSFAQSPPPDALPPPPPLPNPTTPAFPVPILPTPTPPDFPVPIPPLASASLLPLPIDVVESVQPFPVPPPEPAPILPTEAVSGPPALPSGAPLPGAIERITPRVEVWRAGSATPQVPVRHGDWLEQVYMSGDAPVSVRLRFDSLAAGKTVVVLPGADVSFEPPEEIVQISPTGDCILSVTLEEGAQSGRISFYCEGLTTRLSLARVPLAVLAARENASMEAGQ